MVLMEAIASHMKMKKVMLTVFKANHSALDFYTYLHYNIDESSPSKHNEEADYEILSKSIDQ